MRVTLSVAACTLLFYLAASGTILSQDALDELERLIDEGPPADTPAIPPPASDAAVDEASPADAPGYLGVTIDEASPGGRALVLSVRRDGPAASAGLQSGDVITAVNGVQTKSVDAFAEAMRALSVGDDATIEVIRDGRHFEFTATLAARDAVAAPLDEPATVFRPAPDASALTAPIERPILGLRIGPLHTRNYRLLGVSTDWGVVVEDVIPGSPAERYGVPRGAIIVGLGGMRIDHVDDLMAMMARWPVDRPVELTYVLGGRSYRQVIPLQAVSDVVEADPTDPKLPPSPTPTLPAAEPPALPPTPEPPPIEEPAPALPEDDLRLPPAAGAAKVPVDAERIRAMQTELDELRRRAAALEAALDAMRGETDPE